MNPLFLVCFLALSVAQLTLPRRFAFAPLLIAACHLPNLQVVPSFTIVRLLILLGLIRAIGNGVSVWSSHQPLDRLMIVWAGWAVLSSFAHSTKENFNPLTVHASLAYDWFGAYLYSRAYLQDNAALLRFSKCLALVLLPFALLMLVEKTTGRNPYALVGAGIETSWVREGRIRAAGPFAISILAGTVGGVCLPLIGSLYRQHPRWAVAAGAACVAIVFCSGSSGPYMSLAGGLVALALWRWRARMRQIRWGIAFTILALALVMKAPVWYLIARFDIAGGSTSWHRAELIDKAVEHLDEWWLAGTDYTRHWMPYGIEWSEDHVDMTNQYLKLGVMGGLLLMLSFIAVLIKSFQLLGRRMQTLRKSRDSAEFGLWCLGASLFAHCVTFIGISYFDQSFVFLWLMIGSVPGLCAVSAQSLARPASDKKAHSAGDCDASRIALPF